MSLVFGGWDLKIVKTPEGLVQNKAYISCTTNVDYI